MRLSLPYAIVLAGLIVYAYCASQILGGAFDRCESVASRDTCVAALR